MMTLAIGTFSGEDVSRPYALGLDYNRQLAARDAEAALGWQVTIGAKRSADGSVAIATEYAGTEGALGDLTVIATLRHPKDSTFDRQVTLRNDGGGFYRGGLENVATEYKAVELVNYIVNEAVREGASDIHMESMPDKLQVRFRINGLLNHKADLPLSLRSGLFGRIKALAGMKFSDTFRDQAGRLMGSVDNAKVDLRVSTF
ncbi:MAG: FixH family protein, partial [Chloroflexota bacterium]